MSSRDAILQRIRHALADAPRVDAPPVPEVWPRENPTVEQRLDRFVQELEAVQGEVHRCRGMGEAREVLARLMDESAWSTLGMVDRPECRELVADLAEDRLVFPQDEGDTKALAELPVSLVAARWLVADTGTCVVECNTPHERLMCYLPPACVIISRKDQLAEHLPAVWDEIGRETADPQRRGEFVLITGPSRTADIEKILILGVHGPKRLVVLLVE
ncbi:MAG: lactate utilization protein [Planctomycetes bacterium]|nr:lactate utilization protein [Planctomycetota bacterium]